MVLAERNDCQGGQYRDRGAVSQSVVSSAVRNVDRNDFEGLPYASGGSVRSSDGVRVGAEMASNNFARDQDGGVPEPLQ